MLAAVSMIITKSDYISFWSQFSQVKLLQFFLNLIKNSVILSYTPTIFGKSVYVICPCPLVQAIGAFPEKIAPVATGDAKDKHVKNN